MGVTELKEQLEISEEAGVSIRHIAQHARNENSQFFFENFRQGEEEVCIASLARWNAQLKGLVELNKRCQKLMQEVKLLSERQEVLKGMVEDKIRSQSDGTVLRADVRGDEGAGREEIKGGSATCASLESPRKIQVVEVATSEALWNAKGEKEGDGWRLEPEGETETLETKVVSDGVEGVTREP